MSQVMADKKPGHVVTMSADGASSVVLVCEHASHHIPAEFSNLGMPPADQTSHAAWDPGALAVAQHMAQDLEAALVASTVSRLVYDCNRPPSALDAMRDRSELIDIPGNRNLSQSDRDARVAAFYHPFHDAVSAAIRRVDRPVIVTVHSFTPVYHGRRRSVEIGILHDADTRLADAMLNTASAHMTENVQSNAPYGPDDGVTHTLRKHAIPDGHLNVMLEIRNDLIETPAQQAAMATKIVGWLVDACGRLGLSEVGAKCQALHS